MPILNIVLVEPRIPQNVGNIARTCAATGARLHLVEPMAFTIDDAKLKRAGLDYWQYLDVTTYPSLADFMEQHAAEQDKMYYFTTKAQHIYTGVQYPDGCFLLFGREDAGLPEELLRAAPRAVSALPDAAGAAEPQPFQLGGDRGVRGAAAAGFSAFTERRTAAPVCNGTVRKNKLS